MQRETCTLLSDDRSLFVNGWNAWSFCGAVLRYRDRLADRPMYALPSLFVRAFHDSGEGGALHVNLGEGTAPCVSESTLCDLWRQTQHTTESATQRENALESARCELWRRCNGVDYVSSDMFTVLSSFSHTNEQGHRRSLTAGFLSQKEQFGSFATNRDFSRLAVHVSGDGCAATPGAQLCTDHCVMYFSDTNTDTDVHALAVYLSLSRAENDVDARLRSAVVRERETLTGWCSWYHFQRDFTAAQLEENAQEIVRWSEALAQSRYLRSNNPITTAGAAHTTSSRGSSPSAHTTGSAEQQNGVATKSARPLLSLFQIDDGYQPHWGDWLSLRRDLCAEAEGSLSLSSFFQALKERGMVPGLWLAPFAADRESALAREHPDWVLCPRSVRGKRENNGGSNKIVSARCVRETTENVSHEVSENKSECVRENAAAALFEDNVCNSANCGKFFLGLDITHPEVLCNVRETVRALCAQGVQFLKLDFLYCGVLRDLSAHNAPSPLPTHALSCVWDRLCEKLRGVWYDIQRVLLCDVLVNVACGVIGASMSTEKLRARVRKYMREQRERQEQQLRRKTNPESVFYNRSLTRAQALRQALSCVLEASQGEGEDKVWLLGCGAPLGSVLGLVHGNRVSADAGESWLPPFPLPYWDRWNLPCVWNMLRNSLTRAALHRQWWINDPDCLLCRDSLPLSHNEVVALATVKALLGGPLLVSDDLQQIGEERRAMLLKVMPISALRRLCVRKGDAHYEEVPCSDESECMKIEKLLIDNELNQRLCFVYAIVCTAEVVDVLDREMPELIRKRCLSRSLIRHTLTQRQRSSHTSTQCYTPHDGDLLCEWTLFAAANWNSAFQATHTTEQSPICSASLSASSLKTHNVSLVDLFGRRNLQRFCDIHRLLTQLTRRDGAYRLSPSHAQLDGNEHNLLTRLLSLCVEDSDTTNAERVLESVNENRMVLMHMFCFWTQTYHSQEVCLSTANDTENKIKRDHCVVALGEVAPRTLSLWALRLSLSPLLPLYLGSDLHYSCGEEVRVFSLCATPHKTHALLTERFHTSLRAHKMSRSPSSSCECECECKCEHTLSPLVASLSVEWENGLLSTDKHSRVFLFLPSQHRSVSAEMHCVVAVSGCGPSTVFCTGVVRKTQEDTAIESSERVRLVQRVEAEASRTAGCVYEITVSLSSLSSHNQTDIETESDITTEAESTDRRENCVRPHLVVSWVYGVERKTK